MRWCGGRDDSPPGNAIRFSIPSRSNTSRLKNWSAPMTEAEWYACRDPSALWMSLSNWADRSDLVLFGCACCRRIWEFATDERLRRGIEVREQYECGQATAIQLREAIVAARMTRREVRALCKNYDECATEAAPAWAAGAIANAIVGNFSAASDLAARAQACAIDGEWQLNYDIERAAQCDVLRGLVAIPIGDSKEQ
jgi:hypothetical protein